jgi:hypothetical protein
MTLPAIEEFDYDSPAELLMPKHLGFAPVAKEPLLLFSGIGHRPKSESCQKRSLSLQWQLVIMGFGVWLCVVSPGWPSGRTP